MTGSVTGSGTFDGSGNLSITTTTNHNHDGSYVKKSGDTMTGTLILNTQGVFKEGFKTGSQASSNSGSGVVIGADGGIEIYHTSTPFIDFHYKASTADYSVRLICEGENKLSCTGQFYGAV